MTHIAVHRNIIIHRTTQEITHFYCYFPSESGFSQLLLNSLHSPVAEENLQGKLAAFYRRDAFPVT